MAEVERLDDSREGRLVSDKNWIANVVRRADTPAKLLKIVMQYPEYLTDGYYRDLGRAIEQQYQKLLKEAKNDSKACPNCGYE